MDRYSTETIDLLIKLVSIPSPSRQEAAAAAYLVHWMNRHGLAAEVDEAGNAVGVKGRGPREILLLGHIDTFPGALPIRREGSRLYGRGAVDAKGPLAVFAVAASQVRVPEGWQITVVGAVEEEAATSKGARHILARRRVGSGQPAPPAFCIIGEPSRWDRITLGYKGRLLMEVTIQAPFSHSAGEGRLPAEQAVDFWRQVEQICGELNAEQQAGAAFSRVEPSLRHIASHDEGAFGRVELSLSFRLPIHLTPAALEQELASLLDRLPAGTTAAWEFSGEEPAYRGNKSNPLVRAFLAAIRAQGGQPRFVLKTGTADMNVVGPHWPDTPIVAYGPGDSSLDHTPQEHIDLAEYLQAIEVLQAVLERLPG